ncbi:hypothetical protein GGS23DRAFT_613186 [Durotheca rogersii]|uniref:uncharacterized protein n=1 Tax=Durotheca rogersii TaxID=419775 RepID=UPI00221FCA44|nr:uncharacterized protein GGS23DRAFT_613186 [Durotheca rogersii]KAI5861027.1 hypothetical protein GGS23DRAFT_613186 [Durotheca rogersii]
MDPLYHIEDLLSRVYYATVMAGQGIETGGGAQEHGIDLTAAGGTAQGSSSASTPHDAAALNDVVYLPSNGNQTDVFRGAIIRRTPHKVTVDLNGQGPAPWRDIIQHLLPFIRCEPHHCVNDKSFNNGLMNYAVARVTRTLNRHLVWTDNFYGRSLSRAVTSARGNNTTRSIPIAYPTAPPVRTGMPPPRLASLRWVPPPRVFPILSLPVEILFQVLEDVTEPYEVQAHTLSTFLFEPCLIVTGARTWAALSPLFHVCRAFRTYAVGCYGEPRRHSLPFDPKRDSLVVRSFPETYRAAMNAGGIYTAYLRRPTDSLSRMNAAEVRDKFPAWVRDLDSEAVFYHCRPRDANYFVAPTALGADFLRRIRRVEFRTQDGTPENRMAWSMFIRNLGQILPSLRVLTISTWHFDACAITARSILGVVDPSQDGESKKAVVAHCHHDAALISSFYPRPGNNTGEVAPPDVLPSLERLEIVKVGNRCSKKMTINPPGFLSGHYIVSTSDTDRWEDYQ